MLTHSGCKVLQDLVHFVLAGRRIKLVRIHEQVDVLREARDQCPALGKAGPSLEHRLAAETLRNDPKNLCDVVVLLDELLAQTEAAGGLEDRLFEVLVFEQPHLACHSLAVPRICRAPKSNRVRGFRLARSRSSSRGGICNSSPSAPSIARTLGGSAKAAVASRAKLCSSEIAALSLQTVSSAGRSLERARSRRSSRTAPSSELSLARSLGRPVCTIASLRAVGRFGAGVASIGLPGFWVVRPSAFAALRPAGWTGARRVWAAAALAPAILGPKDV